MGAAKVKFFSVASALLVRPELRPVVRFLTEVHVRLYRWTGGKAQVTEHPTLLLTVTGRTTGRERTVPLVYVMDGERFVVAAAYAGSDRDPAWWLNLQAEPTATVEVRRSRIPVRATPAGPDERETLWHRLVAMYPSFTEYQQRTARQIPVIILMPMSETPS